MIQPSDKNLRDLIALHEGRRLEMYQDSEGIWTIGIGHNLEANGISDAVCDLIFEEDVAKAIIDCQKFSWFSELNDVRQAVVVDMMFNMGLPTLSKFTQTIAYLKNGLYHSASREMMDSRWAKQVGSRAKRLSEMMRTGSWE